MAVIEVTSTIAHATRGANRFGAGGEPMPASRPARLVNVGAPSGVNQGLDRLAELTAGGQPRAVAQFDLIRSTHEHVDRDDA